MVNENQLTVTAGQTATITSSLLQFTDNVSTDAQETYTVTTPPADGTLLLNGSSTGTFTQAQIDAGDVSYRETASGAISDSFTFNASDQGGNLTTAQQFQINIRTMYVGTSGSDTFDFTAEGLTSADTVEGGAGYDYLVFTNAGTIAVGSNVSGIDEIDLANGTNTLSLGPAAVANSDAKKMTIQGGSGNDKVYAGNIYAGDTVVFDGGSTSQTEYNAGASAGNVKLTGGPGSDVFEFAAGKLTSSDTVSGGAGHDRIVFTTAGTSTIGSNVRGIDEIDLANGTNALSLGPAPVANSDNKSVTIQGGTGNDTIYAGNVYAGDSVIFDGNGGKNSISGGQGNNTYDFHNIAGQTLTITNAFTGGTAAHGQLDFGAGIGDQKLWLIQSGNNLVADVIGTKEQVTIDNWFGSNKSADLSEIAAAGLKLDSEVAQLVSAMATYSASNPGFNPTASGALMPDNPTLQNAITSAWHA